LIVTSIAMLATILFVPESPVRAPAGINWLGGLLLSAWLTALLLALSEGHAWGLTSAKTLGLAAFAVVLAVLWVQSEVHSRHPLVDMRVMRIRPVWTTNLSALLLGFGMYSAFVLIPQFVQVPESTGYGYGATVTQAGLFLVPSTFAMLLFAPVAGRLSNTVGSKVPLVAGTGVTTLCFVVLVLESSRWEIYVASTLLGVGIGLAFASLANLIVEAVPRDQTGVATGMNTIVRTIGGAFGAQVAASILAGHTLADGYPSEDGYTITFAICFLVMIVAVVASLLVPGRRAGAHEPHVVPAGEPVPAAE
jgi:predicted MFS family arabinose efflux permease